VVLLKPGTIRGIYMRLKRYHVLAFVFFSVTASAFATEAPITPDRALLQWGTDRCAGAGARGVHERNV
jgi:hypothetical protein